MGSNTTTLAQEAHPTTLLPASIPRTRSDADEITHRDPQHHHLACAVHPVDAVAAGLLSPLTRNRTLRSPDPVTEIVVLKVGSFWF